MRTMLLTCTAAMFMAITVLAKETAVPPATQPTTAPVVIIWDQAGKHVGETVTVTGPVISTHVSNDKKNLSLNVGKSYPDPTRLTIFMPNSPDAGSPDDLYKGKTVSVTGKIVLYRKVAEIKTTAKKVIVH